MSFSVGHRNPMALNRAIGSNEDRGANRALDAFALGILPRSPGAVGLHDLNLGIGQKRKWQVELGNELIVRIDIIPADPQNHGIGLGYHFDGITKSTGFFCAAGGIVLGIKIEHDVFTGIIGQRMFFAVATFQIKTRSFFTFLAESINRVWLIFLLPIYKIVIFYEKGSRAERKSYLVFRKLRKACETGDKGRCL